MDVFSDIHNLRNDAGMDAGYHVCKPQCRLDGHSSQFLWMFDGVLAVR